MIRALREYEIAGVRTNIAFCRHVLESDLFQRADYHTGTVDQVLTASYGDELNRPTADEPLLAALLARLLTAANPNENSNHGTNTRSESWAMAGRKSNLREPRT